MYFFECKIISCTDGQKMPEHHNGIGVLSQPATLKIHIIQIFIKFSDKQLAIQSVVVSPMAMNNLISLPLSCHLRNLNAKSRFPFSFIIIFIVFLHLLVITFSHPNQYTELWALNTRIKMFPLVPFQSCSVLRLISIIIVIIMNMLCVCEAANNRRQHQRNEIRRKKRKNRKAVARR